MTKSFTLPLSKFCHSTKLSQFFVVVMYPSLEHKMSLRKDTKALPFFLYFLIVEKNLSRSFFLSQHESGELFSFVLFVVMSLGVGINI